MKNKDKNKILIIGGGRRGLATIEILSEDREMDILAVVDLNPKAPGIKLAQRLDIETARDYRKYFSTRPFPDAVLNLTDNVKIQQDIVSLAKGENVEIMGRLTARLLGSLLMERQVQAELHRVSRKMASDVSLGELVVLILSSCVKGTRAGGGILILLDEKTGRWKVRSNWGLDRETEELLLEKAEDKLPLWLKKDEAMPLGGNRERRGLPGKIKKALCAPLRFRGEVKGAIIATPPAGGLDFTPASRRLLSIFANQSAVAIENVLLYKKSRKLSVTDGLTGVFNHRYFRDQIETELSRARRYDHNFSLAIIDLDNFKDINDNYGHPTGDEVLKKIAREIKKAVRESDTVARYGGDEFVLLLPETDKQGAVTLSERIKADIRSLELGDDIGNIKISAGISAYPDDGVYSEDLVKKADDALYSAKDRGRDRICTA